MINIYWLTQACISLGINNPSIEPDGTIWTGIDDNRTYLSETETNAIVNKSVELQTKVNTDKQAVLDKLGLTADEVAALAEPGQDSCVRLIR